MLRSCKQGRRATGYANASVPRFAPHCSRTLRMPHAVAFGCFTLFLDIFLLYFV
ncbi:MAG: hypothetical protein NZ455_14550 [Bacteroidia bacterium]|nr:hypothetical protein [Bacteroidia bacterium]